jgi:argonaute-like protein implicated in RNA metabolism and viral defense
MHRDKSQPLPPGLQSHLPDADMQEAPRALLRTARRAREVARRTSTPIVYVRDGQLVEEYIADDDSVASDPTSKP